jgi:dystrophin
LKELDDNVETYQQQGRVEAVTRLDQQLRTMKRNWNDLGSKLKKFQKPADFDQKLAKVWKLLNGIEQELTIIDVNTEDVETINLQLEHCMKFYKALSDIKPQIEFVLKQGRGIVDKKQVDNTDELTKQLDTLKQKYNDLGSRVTNGKNELEKASKLSKRFKKEYNIINEFLGKIDGELRKIEQKPLSKNYNDELEWIKNTKNEIIKVEQINLETLKNNNRSIDDLIKHVGTVNRGQSSRSGQQSAASTKINDLEKKVHAIRQRIDDRAHFLQEEAKKLDENYHFFLSRSREMLQQIQEMQHELIEAERNFSRDSFDKLERELNAMISDQESILSQGSDLCLKSDTYSKVVETEMRSVKTNFEDLKRRVYLAQDNLQHHQQQQEFERERERELEIAHAQQQQQQQQQQYNKDNIVITFTNTS